MKNFLFILLIIPLFVFGQSKQKKVTKPKMVVKMATFFDHSKALRDVVAERKLIVNTDRTFYEINEENEYNPLILKGETPGVQDPSVKLQREYIKNNSAKVEDLILEDSFDGGADEDNASSIMPPDTQGDVSPDHYMQCVNNVTTIFDKSGNVVLGPFLTSDFWAGFGDFDDTNDGDAIILWDENAGTDGRWFVSQFAVPASDGNYYELVAVSQTNDPTGSYNRYAFQYDEFNDYPKVAIWPDGYYIGQNAFDGSNSDGIYASVYERDEMIAGNSARMVNFQDVNEFSVFPADADDFTNIPAGAPCYFINDQVATYTDNNEVYIYEFHVDWANTANSTFAKTQTLNVNEYGFFGQTNGDGDSQAEQPGVDDKLDLLHYRTMYRAYYRPFADHNSLLMCRTVDPANDGADADQAGIRWYEFRNTGTDSWAVYQQGTYAPGDGKWRWMPSIAMNANGDIAIGYSISDGNATFPSLAAVARYANDQLDVMTTNEITLFAGGASQSVTKGYTRWGDYSMVSVDPSDNTSFWFTSEYTEGDWDWRTRITHFSLPATCTPPSDQATDIVFSDITDNSIKVSWTQGNGDAELVLVKESSAVNQDPTSGTIYNDDAVFGSGDEIGTGNFVVYDGTAGSVTVTGLTSGVTYYFAIYTYNSADQCYNTTELTGDATTVGPPSVTTDAISSITGSSATSGGDVTSDNGSAVTARGVCWNTAGSPTTADSKTTDGSGTGTFTSSITGLSASTTYYVRAYATNANGTSYGNEETFTTDCGIISSFPWTEDFEDGGNMPDCWSQNYISGDNVDWQFGAGNGSSNPSSAHGGSYNAYLKDGDDGTDETDLITPTFDFSSYSDAEMSFWLYNEDWSGDQDELTIYYKTSASGTWTQIGSVYNDNIDTWTQYTVTLPNLSSDYSIAFRGNALYGYGVCIDDINIDGTLANTAISWTGNSDSNWQNTGNWDSGTIPTSSDDVTIPSGAPNYPIINNGISTVALCNNLTIDAGGLVTIDPNGYMTVTGSITNNEGVAGLVINSDDTGTGSLIQNTSGGVDATVNRKLPSSGRQWHMVASPIDAAPLTVFSSSNNLYYYDESTDDYWTGADYDAGSTSGWTAASGNMGVAEGYVYNNFAETLTFTGQLNDNSSTSSISVVYTNNGGTAPNGSDYDDFDGWNFIGNPYTSAIDWDNAAVDHAGANLLDAVYCYDDETAHTYTSYVDGVGTNGGTQYIPAMQGFFVKGDDTETSGTLNIGSGALVHSDQAFWKSTYVTPKNLIRLEVSSNNLKDETVIRLTDNATFDMDNGLDAYKMFTLEDDVPQIYTNSNSNTEYSINSLKTIDDGSFSIPLKVAQTDGTFTINISEFTFSDVKVYIKDNLTSETVELGLGDILSFTTDASDAEDRFELIFEKGATNIIQAENANVTLYPNPNNGTFFLTVGKDVDSYEVCITNVTGQVVYKNIFNDGYTKELNLNSISNGIYFVKITFSDKSLVNKKIIIE